MSKEAPKSGSAKSGPSKPSGAKPKPSGSRSSAKVSAARSAQAGRRTTFLVVGVVLVVGIAAVIAIAASSGSKSGGSGVAVPKGGDATAIIDKVLSVPQSVSDKVGQGSATSLATAIAPVTGQKPLTQDGKPELLYIGAEYCPYCATERWALAVALSRFGTLSIGYLTHSSGTDVYPNTPTLSFHGSKFDSKYLAFTPVEQTTTDQTKVLDTLTHEQQTLLTALDNPGTSSAGSIPFIDFANKYKATSGATYQPTTLQGKTWATIAADLHDPGSDVAKGALGAANQITAGICKITNNQPASVCTTTAMKAIVAKIP